MPVTKSVKKSLRQSLKKRVFNLRRANRMKLAIKKVQKLISEKEKNKALKELPSAYKAIDKATKRGIIKKNTASRKKSHLTKQINNLSVEKKIDTLRSS